LDTVLHASQADLPTFHWCGSQLGDGLAVARNDDGATSLNRADEFWQAILGFGDADVHRPSIAINYSYIKLVASIDWRPALAEITGDAIGSFAEFLRCHGRGYCIERARWLELVKKPVIGLQPTNSQIPQSIHPMPRSQNRQQ
jgi:hypothetical protein